MIWIWVDLMGHTRVVLADRIMNKGGGGGGFRIGIPRIDSHLGSLHTTVSLLSSLMSSGQEIHSSIAQRIIIKFLEGVKSIEIYIRCSHLLLHQRWPSPNVSKIASKVGMNCGSAQAVITDDRLPKNIGKMSPTISHRWIEMTASSGVPSARKRHSATDSYLRSYIIIPESKQVTMEWRKKGKVAPVIAKTVLSADNVLIFCFPASFVNVSP